MKSDQKKCVGFNLLMNAQTTVSIFWVMYCTCACMFRYGYQVEGETVSLWKLRAIFFVHVCVVLTEEYTCWMYFLIIFWSTAARKTRPAVCTSTLASSLTLWAWYWPFWWCTLSRLPNPPFCIWCPPVWEHRSRWPS